ncbi:hypothetical protein HRI_002623000 [Hibiscus trionum]|uniref:Retrotransposon Copia-like N-terminal domain-containing protein n=1 Tax=Hibiscus trionum TaxID=183268 RepID=A0A9W7M4J4_HIBTR|nr:hypothetical protein HRI_002623000 [Hibiscus trionum]
MVSEGLQMAERFIAKPFKNKTISIRLDDSNFLLWRQRVLFSIESLALLDHIDGALKVPSQYVLVPDGSKRLNPECVFFQQQDNALCSWLLSSIGSSILPFFVSCKKTLDIWEKVQQIFFVSSTTKLMHLHCSLKSLRKRDQSMKEYLAQIQSICDSLAACSHPLSDTMHISAILSGLPPEYELVVAVITSSKQLYKIDGVCNVLFNTETRDQEFLSQSFSINMAGGSVQNNGMFTRRAARSNFSNSNPSQNGFATHNGGAVKFSQ